MMVAILNSAMLDSDTAILDSDTLLSSLRFTQKHSHSILTLIQTNSIWLKLIHSHLTWWWQPSCTAILNSDILDSAILLKTLTPTNSIWLKVIHSDSNWWWQPSWILPWLNSDTLLDSSILDSLKNTHTLPRLVPTICTKKLHSFILTQLDDGSHLEFYHVGLDSDTLLSSLRITQKHSHSILTLTQTNSIWLKVIHSHLTWWWQPSCILPSWILTSWILPFCSKLWLQLIQSDSKSFILTQLDDGSHLGFSHFAQQKLHSFILTQLDDGSHIEFWHIGFSHLHKKTSLIFSDSIWW